jgi:hypothetical protein
LHNTKWTVGKKKKGWKTLSSKQNVIQDSDGHEENRCPVPDPNNQR